MVRIHTAGASSILAPTGALTGDRLFARKKPSFDMNSDLLKTPIYRKPESNITHYGYPGAFN